MNILPSLRQSTGRHRADERLNTLVDDYEKRIASLRTENVSLHHFKREADDFFALLANDVSQTNTRWESERERRLQAEAALSQARERIADLEAELAPHWAAEANEHRIDVPPMERDTSAVEDQATAPIDVRPLWDAHRPRQARQTSWGRDADDTQPPPAI